MERWRLLAGGKASGAINMAIDEVLLTGLAKEGGRPVLRFYGWEPPAISFGYGQDPRREVDLEKCRAAGIDLVRRLTGGRAVLHWEELTYSVVCGEDDPKIGGGIEETYRRIGECLVEGLRRFGVEATLERVTARPVRPRETGVTAPCFSSIARWEVKCRGRKLIGSAQRRVEGAILQHGSLLIGKAHRQLLELLSPMPERLREAWRRQLEVNSIELEECVGGEVEVEALAHCLAAGFGHCLGVELEPGELEVEEERQVQKLAMEKYGNLRWICREVLGETPTGLCRLAAKS